MREIADNPVEVLRLAGHIQERVVRELHWEADNCATVRHYREAWKLRRQAERFTLAGRQLLR